MFSLHWKSTKRVFDLNVHGFLVCILSHADLAVIFSAHLNQSVWQYDRQ